MRLCNDSLCVLTLKLLIMVNIPAIDCGMEERGSLRFGFVEKDQNFKEIMFVISD